MVRTFGASLLIARFSAIAYTFDATNSTVLGTASSRLNPAATSFGTLVEIRPFALNLIGG